ncbi:MAG: diguanylate cyclase [Nitrosomonadales bacterium]|nr:diguanylate cyclase [Nitrosomonadales bacterium]
MKILLVDDSRSTAAIMLARLTSLGYEVTHALDGREAVDLFRKIAPDLILMDIEMPVMNGFEATTRIRAEEATYKWAWTPIIFLTASDTQDNLVMAIEAGGDDFILKKVPEPILHAKMKAMSRIARLRADLSIANRQLEEMATRDRLTGLYNRRYLDMQVDALWDRPANDGAVVAVLMIDVDNFKKYNDRYGHQAGDDCLAGVAKAISSAVAGFNSSHSGKESFAARYGGEEFAVIIPDGSGAAATDCAQAVHDALKALAITHETNGDFGVVTVSIGVSLSVPAAGATIANAFRQADAALYQSKESGRSRTTIV